jgi:hypothetical protein
MTEEEKEKAYNNKVESWYIFLQEIIDAGIFEIFEDNYDEVMSSDIREIKKYKITDKYNLKWKIQISYIEIATKKCYSSFIYQIDNDDIIVKECVMYKELDYDNFYSERIRMKYKNNMLNVNGYVFTFNKSFKIENMCRVLK